MKRTNRRIRELQIRFKGILTILFLAAAIAGVIWFVRTRPPKVVQEGVSHIQEMESQEVSQVEDTIREAEVTKRRKEREEKLAEAKKKLEEENKKAQDEAAKKEQDAQELLEASVNDTMAQIERGEIDVWSLFGDVFILGDSRSEPFSYYNLLDETRVFAIKGANLRKADQGVSQAQAANVPNLIFTYGLNDANGNWATALDFIAKYEEVIEQYKAVLPDAKIFIASIAGVTDRAISGSPALAQIPAYNQAIRDLCEEKGYFYIECETLLTEHEDLYAPDGEHFNRDLYDYWGQLMIREVLLHEGAGGADQADTADAGKQGDTPEAEKKDETAQPQAAAGQVSEGDTVDGAESGEASGEETAGGTESGEATEGETSGGAESGNGSEEETAGGTESGNGSEGETAGGAESGEVSEGDADSGAEPEDISEEP